ncbi:putative family 17 glucosidase SCW4 [Wickerhamomyces ciferrii]|uniref:Family 17 glucosidase SCW4 n=1 Tax=Wickerhamomyces ciferrii (strain ATCC 14091 / BCRC 22168 / CBS 111 / JCM 3599 / NBRC 0793 / NRRL Y-1031 F-60-10) TaxID=1206466 RepID=K0KYQ8_WICCF|nr:putative family 17 glucosidase SCW4 [Wickerhamomyces ciferrii]CCH46213.1 putative family 17 glucosidase SCW4 [Wickerhamomyces ciferrii]
MLFSSLFKSAVAATLIGSSVASPAQHAHNEHKRGVVVVTHTSTVIVTAGQNQVVGGQSTTRTFSTVDTGLAAPSSLSTTISRDAPVADFSSHTFSYSSDATTTLASASTTSTKEESSVAPSSTSSTSSAALPSSTGGNNFSDGKGVTYSPYTASGQCKSSDEVKKDVSALKGFEIIRLYGVDCNQVENVLQAKADGQKVFLGVYFVDQIQDGVNQIADAIEKYSSWDDVHTVSIGNELVNGGLASVSQVGEYVQAGKSALKSRGYTGPVVSVDTFIATINNPGLCEHSDYIAVNAHAYFDQNTEAQDAGEWVLLQIQRVWTACGADKSVFITESGWPSRGDTYGKAVASKEAQKSAIESIKSTVGDSVILFNAYNDLWKADGAQNCEKYWGILSN